jgi:16S rRNA (adenine1518-N6/adenine1519-N6)-dimethyltransferase
MRKPKLGQNFLRDAGASRRIVEALGDTSHSTVIEIGPGRGVLTRLLAERTAHLIAIELDSRLAAELRSEFDHRRNVEILEANFLDVNLAGLLQGHASNTRAKIIGNIPYYITSDILLRLFAQEESIETIVIMVQKEVADRLAAEPGSRDYGMLTVTAQLFSDIEGLFALLPSMFSPPPKVHSTVLRLRIAPKSTKLNLDANAFMAFCKLAFSQKRKTLVNNLRGRYGVDEIKKTLQTSGVPEDVRAEALSLEKLANIYKELDAL